jgi:hypothetical protein
MAKVQILIDTRAGASWRKPGFRASRPRAHCHRSRIAEIVLERTGPEVRNLAPDF